MGRPSPRPGVSRLRAPGWTRGDRPRASPGFRDRGSRHRRGGERADNVLGFRDRGRQAMALRAWDARWQGNAGVGQDTDSLPGGRADPRRPSARRARRTSVLPPARRRRPGPSPGATHEARGLVALESFPLRDLRTQEAWVELLCDSTSVFLEGSAGHGIAWPLWALTFEDNGRRVPALIADPESAARLRDGTRIWNGIMNTQRSEFLRAIAVSFPT